MAEEQKKTEEGFQSFCGGMPCGDMMRKMLEAKKSGQSFNCAEMMSQMMQMWGEPQKRKRIPPQIPRSTSFPFLPFPALCTTGRKLPPAVVSSHRRSLLPFFFFISIRSCLLPIRGSRWRGFLPLERFLPEGQ